jgi:hypothetical protein
LRKGDPTPAYSPVAIEVALTVPVEIYWSEIPMIQKVKFNSRCWLSCSQNQLMQRPYSSHDIRICQIKQSSWAMRFAPSENTAVLYHIFESSNQPEETCMATSAYNQGQVNLLITNNSFCIAQRAIAQ